MSEPSVSMHHVGIVVRDLDRAEAFLRGTLGLPVIDRFARTEVGKRSAFLACGPAMIELIEFTDPAVVGDGVGVPTSGEGGGGTALAYRTVIPPIFCISRTDSVIAVDSDFKSASSVESMIMHTS